MRRRISLLSGPDITWYGRRVPIGRLIRALSGACKMARVPHGGGPKRAGPGSRSAGQFRYLVRAPRGRGPRARHNLPPLTDDDISGRANRRDGPGARRSAAAISAHVRSIILAAVRRMAAHNDNTIYVIRADLHRMS